MRRFLRESARQDLVMSSGETGVGQASAPGQYLGYSLQASRLLDHLLRSGPGDTVSLEVFSDTGIQSAGGATLAEEAKSRTAPGNPIADRAEDLWKTLRNWVEAIQAGTLDVEKTHFRIWVSRSFPGDLAHAFSAARTREEAGRAITVARALMLDADQKSLPGIPAKAKPRRSTVPAKVQRHAQVVFGVDSEILTHLILKFEIEFGSGRSLDDLKSSMNAAFVPQEICDDVLRYALGWLKARTDTLIEQGEPATIAWDEFGQAIIAVVRKLDRRGFLASVAGEPGEADVSQHLSLRTYVRQLMLIEIEDDDKIRAVTDYIKAEADRVDWAQKGYVVEGSFDDFASELLAAWGNYKRKCDVVHKRDPAVDRGRVLYSDCFGHVCKLDGAEVPDHFRRGSFHKLSDERVIGWHPDYAVLLSEKQTTQSPSRAASGMVQARRARGRVSTRGRRATRSNRRSTQPGKG